MPTYRCVTHNIVLETNRDSSDHGEQRRVTFDVLALGSAQVKHPCVLLLVPGEKITPGKMKLSDYLPRHVFGKCEVVEVG